MRKLSLCLLLLLPALGRGDCLLEKPVESVREIDGLFEFLRQFPTGRRVADDVEPKFLKGEISILEFTAQVEAVFAPGRGYKSIFTHINEVPTIFLANTELGLAAVYLLHEGIHSLDLEFRQERRTSEIRKKQEAAVSAELKAYDEQVRFIQEIVDAHECAGPYYEARSKMKKITLKKMTREEIRSTYGLN